MHLPIGPQPDVIPLSFVLLLLQLIFTASTDALGSRGARPLLLPDRLAPIPLGVCRKPFCIPSVCSIVLHKEINEEIYSRGV